VSVRNLDDDLAARDLVREALEMLGFFDDARLHGVRAIELSVCDLNGYGHALWLSVGGRPLGGGRPPRIDWAGRPPERSKRHAIAVSGWAIAIGGVQAGRDDLAGSFVDAASGPSGLRARGICAARGPEGGPDRTDLTGATKRTTNPAGSAMEGSPRIVDGKLRPCPNRPNCVSSDAEDEPHHIAPFPVARDDPRAFDRIVEVAVALPRTRVLARSERYLHAEVRSRVFRFVDDLELHYRPDAGIVAVRSASRVGRGDLGVNRRRVETIRSRLERA